MANQSKGKAMLSGPHQRFCDGIVAGMPKGAAYRAAYPKTTAAAAGPSATALLKNPKIEAEIARQRAEAERKAGSPVLTLARKREICAAIAECPSDVYKGSKIKATDRLKAIEIDNDLAGEGSGAEGQDALAKLLERVMK